MREGGFPLLERIDGRSLLKSCYAQYARIARRAWVRPMLESTKPTLPFFSRPFGFRR